jgi:hypothetical protein
MDHGGRGSPNLSGNRGLLDLDGTSGRLFQFIHVSSEAGRAIAACLLVKSPQHDRQTDALLEACIEHVME